MTLKNREPSVCTHVLPRALAVIGPSQTTNQIKKNLSQARCVISVKPNDRTETVSRQCARQEHGNGQSGRSLDLDLPD